MNEAGGKQHVVAAALTCTQGRSDKFWTMITFDRYLAVAYGRNGRGGQTSIKAYDSVEAAQAEAIRRLDDKTMKKGYDVVHEPGVYAIDDAVIASIVDCRARADEITAAVEWATAVAVS